ncbi:cysteine desulfurase family protein [Anaerosacchariphilus polymeriproducens]|uniref:Cysteine desulfurase n=1 Tax=Anaerosacchariphilus polymeriproducens TaxID=1812858 RepID=A0A371ASA7_9FIRM|nr:cysteine desulfurase family protein [Anaerosacchariphilus polymeriproducens]RDU22458.1 cysteine desulfurase [Anaerosacchariphilus polymeriproducens]
MEVYFDNSATTRCYESVAKLVVQLMTQDYGNPSSMHTKGFEAEKYIREAREIISKNLKVNEKEIFFTSGGTESNNLAIIGTAMANQRSGKHLITTSIEHPSVLNAMKYLEEQGFEVTYLPVDEKGVLKLEDLKDALRKDTILVSIMHVNNEIGSLQPIEQAAKIVKENNSKTLIHVDAIQSFGKFRILPTKLKIDLLSISGHKIHGPKGIGVLYVHAKVKIRPINFGGEQQKGIRSGTENVPGIAGLGVAIKEVYTDFEEKQKKIYEIKQSFIKQIKEIEGIVINGAEEAGAPHIVSVSFEGVRSEVLLHALEEKNIYVSAGSACASNKPAISSTLKGINVKKELLDATIRFSFSFDTTFEEIDYCIQSLKEILPRLRKYTRH